MRMRRAPGFTILDVMIVVAIIGFLATIALDEFNLLISRAKRTEAITGLSAVWTAEKVYYNTNNGVYSGSLADIHFEVEGGVLLTPTKLKGQRYTFYLSQPWGPASFYCAAVGQIDADIYPDVVTIEEGRP